MPDVTLALTILYVYVHDLARAAAFYDAAFGWSKRVDVPVHVEDALNAGARLGLLPQGNTRQFLGDALGGRTPSDGCPRAEVYVHVDDLDAAVARLEAAGAPCTSPRAPRGWGDEAAYDLDRDGYVVAVARPLVAGPWRGVARPLRSEHTSVTTTPRPSQGLPTGAGRPRRPLKGPRSASPAGPLYS